MNSRFRQATRRRGHLPSEQAALEVLYLTVLRRRPNRANPQGIRQAQAWVDFASREMAAWPTTKNLGMSNRTRLPTEIVAAGESVLDNRQRAEPQQQQP